MCRELKRLGLTKKKTLPSSQAATDLVQILRGEYWEKVKGVAELRYDKCGQGMFWLPDLPRLSAIEMIP
jgi:hypothetical protein